MADEPLVYIPPSQQSAQGPVPKPGEPVHPVKGILAEKKEEETQTQKEAQEPKTGVEMTGPKSPRQVPRTVHKNFKE